jgi:hypothetical protein
MDRKARFILINVSTGGFLSINNTTSPEIEMVAFL